MQSLSILVLNGRWIHNLTFVDDGLSNDYRCQQFLKNMTKKTLIEEQLKLADPCPCSLGEIQGVNAYAVSQNVTSLIVDRIKVMINLTFHVCLQNEVYNNYKH